MFILRFNNCSLVIFRARNCVYLCDPLQ